MQSVYLFVSAILLIVVGILSLYIMQLKSQVNRLDFELEVANEELREWRIRLLEKMKEKIFLTSQVRDKLHLSDDIIAEFIYNEERIKKLEKELEDVFCEEVSSIRAEYPLLTELDLLVIMLLGIGMDNLEICTLIRMEKKTLYRRRQLIAGRMGISSLQLDEWAMGKFLQSE